MEESEDKVNGNGSEVNKESDLDALEIAVDSEVPQVDVGEREDEEEEPEWGNQTVRSDSSGHSHSARGSQKIGSRIRTHVHALHV